MPGTLDNLFWDQLLQLIEGGHVIPIVGRDLLLVKYHGREAMLYPLIAEKLAEYLHVPWSEFQEGDEINSIVYRCIEKKIPIEDIYSALKIIMPLENEISIPESFIKLATIRPFNLFVTTTFDSLLERAINQKRFHGQSRTEVLSYAPNSVEDLSIIPSGMRGTTVFHLFGKLSAIPAYAVTQEDILEFVHSLQSKAHQPQILFDELNRNNLLILGCGFGDWLARFFIRTSKHQRLLEARGSINFVADSRISSDPNLMLFLKYYSSHTRILESLNAREFIDELHCRWVARHPDGGQTKVNHEDNFRYPTSGTIFLSYASEDVDAVIKIKDSLEKEGMSVFFDKNELEAGDSFQMKLKYGISACTLFIPVISKNTLTIERRSFRIEWNHAFIESQKVAANESFIIPVVIDDTSYSEMAVPENFRNLHWENLPEGQTNPKFLSMIKKLYRKYKKMDGGTL